MLDTFRSLFGTYEPIQSVVSGSAIDGTAIYCYSIDWSYIFNAVLVCILVYSFCRLLGLMFGGGRR